MTVYIVQVVNNTSRTVHYRNLETGHKVDIEPKTDQYENNDWIPSSNYHDDAVPHWKSSHIEVKLDDGPVVDLSDNNGKFRMVGPVEGTSERAASEYGSQSRSGQYILKLDEVHDGLVKSCGFTFLEYEDKFKVTAGHVASQLIQQAAPVIAMVLMAIFL